MDGNNNGLVDQVPSLFIAAPPKKTYDINGFPDLAIVLKGTRTQSVPGFDDMVAARNPLVVREEDLLDLYKEDQAERSHC